MARKGACGGFNGFGAGLQQRGVTGVCVSKENHVRMIANGFAIFRPEKVRYTPRLSAHLLVVDL